MRQIRLSGGCRLIHRKQRLPFVAGSRGCRMWQDTEVAGYWREQRLQVEAGSIGCRLQLEAEVASRGRKQRL